MAQRREPALYRCDRTRQDYDPGESCGKSCAQAAVPRPPRRIDNLGCHRCMHQYFRCARSTPRRAQRPTCRHRTNRRRQLGQFARATRSPDLRAKIPELHLSMAVGLRVALAADHPNGHSRDSTPHSSVPAPGSGTKAGKPASRPGRPVSAYVGPCRPRAVTLPATQYFQTKLSIIVTTRPNDAATNATASTPRTTSARRPMSTCSSSSPPMTARVERSSCR